MHSLRHAVLLLSGTLLTASCGPAPSEAGEPLGSSSSALVEWSVIELADGFKPSLALDPSGVPAVSLAQGVPNPTNDAGDVTPVLFTNDGTWQSGTGWSSENVGYAPGYTEGSHNSLALLGTTPQIVYGSRYRHDFNAPMVLEFATKGGLGWQVETLDDDGWIYQAVQRVADGRTWVVYPDPTTQYALRIATMEAGVWTTHLLASIPHNLLNSLDAALTPGEKETTVGVATTTLSAVGGAPRGLHFASSEDGGSSWAPVVHVDATGAMISPQLAFAGENPRVAYSEVDAHRAKFAFSNDGGLTWNTETIATFGANPATGLAIDPQTGDPVVAITVADTLTNEGRLYVARRNAFSGWSLDLVDTVDGNAGYSFGSNPRVVITADGTVALAYSYTYLGSARHVRFAWSKDA